MTLSMGCAPSAVGPAATAGVAAPADGLDALTDEQLVRKFLDVMGASSLGMLVADQMMETFRKMPNLPPGFVDKLRQNMKPEQLTEMIVPIYLKHLDHKTLVAAIRFYQSPEGRVIVKALPVVTAESGEAGKQWGMALATKTLKDLGVPTP